MSVDNYLVFFFEWFCVSFIFFGNVFMGKFWGLFFWLILSFLGWELIWIFNEDIECKKLYCLDYRNECENGEELMN